MNAPISHVLLDIEGTTCPVRFVSETLFPYATAQLETFLGQREGDSAVRELVAQVARAWREDPHPTAQALLQAAPSNAGSMTLVVPYLRWLIEEDRKLTPLKELQGLIWEEGYGSGELQGPLYPDVAPALHRWRQAGLTLAVYSSGSVKAQQLIYGHSNAGDLRSWFHYWFDTRMGPKLEPASYIRIVEAMGAEASMVLFISDSIGELEAARSNGLPVLFSDRHGSDDSLDLPARFPTITSFDGLNPRRVA
jgi:enolase-phosphatase E1